MMPLSAGLLRSQRNNANPQCPPRIQVQHLKPVSWTRVPSEALKVTVEQPDDCQGWRIQCSEALQVMNIQIPDENRLGTITIFLVLFLHNHLHLCFQLINTMFSINVMLMIYDIQLYVPFQPSILVSILNIFVCFELQLFSQVWLKSKPKIHGLLSDQGTLNQTFVACNHVFIFDQGDLMMDGTVA